MAFNLTILGCGSATPTLNRNPTSQLLKVNSKQYLIDCGEGTQLQLRRQKINLQRIDHIFISHLHGDHYLGLPGLISSMSLLGREKELNLYGPPDLKEIIMMNIKYSKTYLSFHINFHSTQIKKFIQILDLKDIEVYSIPLKHRVDCTGFLFREKPNERNIIKKFIPTYNLGIAEIVKLKSGENITRENGEVISYEKVTSPPQIPSSYAFCSDTKYYTKVIEHVKEVTVLYHEATFLDELKDRARATFHSTTKEAASIAKQANVKKLLIGHYSSRYIDVSELEKEARTIFENTTAVNDGMVFDF